MSGLVSFKTIGKHQHMTNFEFRTLFGGLYDRYLNAPKAPKLSKEIYMMVMQYLGQCWPEKYSVSTEDGHWDETISTSWFPLTELMEWSRALTAFITDARRGDFDPNLMFNPDHTAELIARMQIQTALLQEEIEAMKRVN
jgi:hypothetical protein